MKKDSCNLAGIDVSAKRLVVAACRTGRPAEHTFDNDCAGHRTLIRWLRPRKNRRARVCLEATGLYHLELALALNRAGIEVMVLNPRVAKDYQRARFKRAKNDPIDAAGLLDYLQRQDFVAWAPPAENYLLFRQITRRMRQLKDHQTAEKNRLAACLVLGPAAKVIVTDLKQSVAQIEKRLEALQRQAMALVQADSHLSGCFDLLISIKGIAQTSALSILGELILLAKHMKPAQWVAHAGLDPRVYQSGSSIDLPRHISHQGNAYLRAALYMPALVASRFNTPVKAYYQHLLRKGKKKMVALTAIMRKLLHCIWGMFRHQQLFDPARFTSLDFSQKLPNAA